MKKLIVLALALTLLTSCGSTPASDSSDSAADTGDQSAEVTTSAPDTDAPEVTTAAADTTAAVKSDATFECKLDIGVTVIVGAKADDIIKSLTDALGEPLDYMEAPSCVHEGTDRVYTFDGFTVSTSPDASGTEYVTELSLLSDAVALENDIMIGSPSDDVTAALGSDFEEKFGVRKYSLDGISISITFTDDAVTAFSVSKPI